MPDLDLPGYGLKASNLGLLLECCALGPVKSSSILEWLAHHG